MPNELYWNPIWPVSCALQNLAGRPTCSAAGAGAAWGAARHSDSAGLGAQEAVQELLQRVAEANACLPYSGVAAGARPDEAVLVALLSLLPPPPPPDANPPPPQAL